jgi:hypothetical protein
MIVEANHATNHFGLICSIRIHHYQSGRVFELILVGQTTRYARIQTGCRHHRVPLPRRTLTYGVRVMSSLNLEPLTVQLQTVQTEVIIVIVE